MFARVVLLAITVAGCRGDAPEPPPFRCGEIPNTIYSCLGNPKLVKTDVAEQCKKSVSECERLKCIFDKSGWLDGDKVDKAEVVTYFDQYAKDHPEWSTAVDVVKSECLTNDLPAQGVHVSCPAYDVAHCSLHGFIKNAKPSQWSKSDSCEYPRQFAAACPLCPSDCFAPLVPYGSCAACVLLPRSP